MNKTYNTWSWKDALWPGAIIVLVCIVCCQKSKSKKRKPFQIKWFQRCWIVDKWRNWKKSNIFGLAKSKTKCVVRSNEFNIMDIDPQLQEIGIDVIKDLGHSKLPIIAPKYCVSRLEDEISGGLRGFSDEDIMRTILMLLYKPPMGYGMHGSVDDPKNIHYSSETQDNYRYKKLKGIIHLQLDQNGKINFKNCDAEVTLKRWIKEIQDEIDKM